MLPARCPRPCHGSRELASHIRSELHDVREKSRCGHRSPSRQALHRTTGAGRLQDCKKVAQITFPTRDVHRRRGRHNKRRSRILARKLTPELFDRQLPRRPQPAFSLMVPQAFHNSRCLDRLQAARAEPRALVELGASARTLSSTERHPSVPRHKPGAAFHTPRFRPRIPNSVNKRSFAPKHGAGGPA